MATEPNGTDTFSTVEDAMSSYVSDEEREQQDDGQGGQSEQQADNGQTEQQEAGPDDVTDQDPDLDDGTDEIDATAEEDPGAEGLVPHDAKVKLADGTVTTVAEIVRGTLRNADYTKKTTELAQREQKFEEAHSVVRQQYETLTQQQQRLAAIAQAFLPKRPDPAMMQTDLVGYNVQLDAYNRTVEMLQALDSDYQTSVKTQTDEQKQALETFRAEQADKLVERDPKFADDKYYRQFWTDMQSIGGRVYGYTAKELTEGMNDHRQYLVMRDALAFQRIKANQRKAKGQQGQRQTPQNGTGRQPMPVNGRPQNADMAKRQAAQERFNQRPTLNNALDLID
jgi:hypothetical protein